MNATHDAPLGFAALPAELRARVEAELAPGERLLWAAQPDPKRPGGHIRANAASWVWMVGLVMLSLICGIATIPLRGTSYQSIEKLLICMFIFSSYGAMLFGLSWMADLAKYGVTDRMLFRQLYALTDRRVLIWSHKSRNPAVSVRQIAAGSIPGVDVERQEYPDGSGNLLLGMHRRREQGFFGVADVRRVDELVRRVFVLPASLPNLESVRGHD